MAARMCIAEPYRDCRAQIEELPQRLEREGVTLHSGRNLIKRLQIAGPGGAPIDVAVKAFAVPAPVRGFVYANVRQSKARRCMINARKLAELGLSWERLSAVDGRRLEPHHERLIDRAAHATRGLEFSPGAIGCWLSHHQAQRMVAEGIEPMALILEDDIAIADDLPDVLERLKRGDARPSSQAPAALAQHR